MTEAGKNNTPKTSVFQAIKAWFFQIDIRLAQGVPLGLGAALLFLWPMIGMMIVGDSFQTSAYAGKHMPYVCLLLSLAGVVAIIRREFYWSRYATLKGLSAEIAGFVLTALCIFAAVVLFFL